MPDLLPRQNNYSQHQGRPKLSTEQRVENINHK
jgi:hypothetical protein